MKKFIFCVIAGLMVPGWMQAAEVKARVSSVSGTVAYAAPGSSQFSPLAAGAEVEQGSKVRSEKGGEAVIVMVPGVAMELAENSEMTVNLMDVDESASEGIAKRKTLVSLKSGTVSALIDPSRSKETDFKIQTPQGIAAARGTFYAVTVQDGKTYVGVKRGKVAVAYTPPGEN